MNVLCLFIYYQLFCLRSRLKSRFPPRTQVPCVCPAPASSASLTGQKSGSVCPTLLFSILLVLKALVVATNAL